MKEMLLVGRGGEGVVLASQLLADALARAGYFVQSFPEFKAERRGAPISAYLRWDEEPIHRRYKLRECDVLVVVSPGAPAEDALRTLRPGGLVVLNLAARYRRAGSFTVVRVPASGIARECGAVSSEGRPMGNTAVLGACVRQILPGGLRFLEAAIDDRMDSLADVNIAAARAGFGRCVRQHTRVDDERVAAASDVAPLPSLQSVYPVSTQDSLSVFTGSWSLERPTLHEACTGCAVCVLFCPEGAIMRDDGVMSVDYFYCKGCGVCEVVCPVRGAVSMEAVPA